MPRAPGLDLVPWASIPYQPVALSSPWSTAGGSANQRSRHGPSTARTTDRLDLRPPRKTSSPPRQKPRYPPRKNEPPMTSCHAAAGPPPRAARAHRRYVPHQPATKYQVPSRETRPATRRAPPLRAPHQGASSVRPAHSALPRDSGPEPGGKVPPFMGRGYSTKGAREFCPYSSTPPKLKKTHDASADSTAGVTR